MQTYHIGIDLMGSESSPLDLFQSVLHAASSFKNCHFHVLVTSPIHRQLLHLITDRVHFRIVDQVIEMDDDPIISVREKKRASLIVGLDLLREKKIDALITAGNTGALIAGCSLFLPSIGPMRRPALLATIPVHKGRVTVLDVGGLVKVHPGYFLELAMMGSAFHKSYFGVSRPKLALLNIGTESKKGTETVKKAYAMLSQHAADYGLNFVGNMEAREIFFGEIDVLLTEGFAGNVFIKSCEGMYNLVEQELKILLENATEKQAVMHALAKQFSYEESMGAIVCGVDGIVIKCHGKSTVNSLLSSITGAINLISKQFISSLQL